MLPPARARARPGPAGGDPGPAPARYPRPVAKERATPGSQTSLREANRARIVAAVQQRGSVTQIEIAGATGLSTATVSNIVKELTQAGVLATAPTSRSGRRAMAVTLARSRGLVAGIHFAERSLRVAVADLTGRVVAEQRLPLPKDHRPDISLDRGSLLVEELVDSLGAGQQEVLGVGVGLAAPVDPNTGIIGAERIMAAWGGTPVGAALEDRWRIPVAVDNDANLGAFAEVRFGAAQGYRHVAYLRAAHGTGLGLVLDGRVYHGRGGGAGELGHMIVVEGGEVCQCGSRGCLQTTIGADALLARITATHGHQTLRDVVTGALMGDAGHVAVLGDAGRRLGAAAATVVALLDPELVVVGGDLAHAGDILLAPLRAELAARSLVSRLGPPPVVAGTLGDQAEVRGAVALAVDTVNLAALGGAS